MTASQLLRLYPRAWQERYGEEFLATVGDGALRLQQIIDIVSGAVDAWFSSDVRRSTTGPSQQGDVTMHQLIKAACGQGEVRYTTRDSLFGAAVLLVGTFVLMAIGIFLSRQGWPVTGEAFKSLAFPVSLAVSMPMTFLKGQPRKAQIVICVGTVLMLGGATYVATLI